MEQNNRKAWQKDWKWVICLIKNYPIYAKLILKSGVKQMPLSQEMTSWKDKKNTERSLILATIRPSKENDIEIDEKLQVLKMALLVIGHKNQIFRLTGGITVLLHSG